MEDNTRQISFQLNELKVFIYLQEAEQMPANAPDEWFLGTNTSIPAIVDDSEKFANGLQYITGILTDQMTEEEIQAVFYDAGKLFYGSEKAELRTFFRGLYLILFHKPQGPRWGQFVIALGVDKFSELVYSKLNNPLN